MSVGRRRVAIGLGDQMLYSLTNFMVTLLVARYSSTIEFGTYALLMATLLILTAVNRGLTAEPVIVAHSNSDPAVWRRVVETKLCVALVFGELSGLALLEITQHLLPHEFARLGVVFAVAPVVVFAQDFLRYAALAAARPFDALANDFSVVVVQIVTVVALVLTTRPTAEAMVGVWVAATAVGLVVGIWRLRVVLRVPSRADLRADVGLAGRFAVDNLITQLSQQGVGYAVAATAGLAAAGGFRAAQTVYMPLAVLVLGVQAAVVPELVRARARSADNMKRVTARLGLGVAVACALFTLLATAGPDRAGRAVFGDSWAEAAPLIVFIGVGSIAGGLVNIAVAGLRAMADASRTLRVRWVSVALTIGCVVPGAMIDDARGAAIGLIVASWAQAGLWWWQLRSSWRSDTARIGAHVSRSRERTALRVSDGTA